jgi:hypothetical protein
MKTIFGVQLVAQFDEETEDDSEEERVLDGKNM